MSEIEKMAELLRPYGLDGQQTLARKKVALVSCRQDLTPEDLLGHEPIVSNERMVLLFDGRIDNRTELAATLGFSKSELETMPDSVMALHAVDRWGADSFARFAGVFAVIVFYPADGRLICARDHVGLRVLHYHRSAEHFAVATTPEALLALSWVPRVINKNKIADTLVHRGLNGETTYYENIYRVLPGSFIQIQGDRFIKEKYWKPENIAPIKFKSDLDYVEAFQELLEQAVRATLRSNRTPCATITGGLDSSSIAVVAGDVLASEGKALKTFTAVPPPGFHKEETRGRYFDETPYVREIAELNGNIFPRFVTPSDGPFLEQVSQLVNLGGAPSSGVFNDLWTVDLLTEAQAAGHNVMLGGEGGNFTISYGGWTLLSELLIRGHWLDLVNELKSSGYRWKHLLRHWTLAPLVPAPIFRMYKKIRRGSSSPWQEFSAIDQSFALQSQVVARAAQEFLPFDSPPPKNGKDYRLSRLNCYCETADWFTQIRGRFGIDVRTPALDRRIVEFCVGIPQNQYFRDGCDRWLIRRAMKGRLPESVIRNSKTGIQAADWFERLGRERSSLLAEINRISHNPQIGSVIDTKRLRSILEGWPLREPMDYSAEASALFVALPIALSVAQFLRMADR